VDPSSPPVADPAPARPDRRADWLIALALAALTFLLYVPSLANSFVDYDDHQYVTANPVVQRGLTWAGVKWAFTTTRFSNWLPVTWLSHMLDCQLFGMDPAGHHASSAALHAFNAAALFVAVRMMTGRRWVAAAVAAVFAAHPLRVESVSWVAERKDVLCATFFMLSLIAYTHYCRRPSGRRYALVALCHALGLMSKTMLVTLPVVLLLLDYWPMRRLRPGESPRRDIVRLVLEKLPLLGLSVVSSAWTVLLQSGGGAMDGGRRLSLPERVANALVSVPRYLAKIAWPADLSVFYPHPGRWPGTYVFAASILLVAVSAGALLNARRRPHLFVGWFWFLGMLLPVCGIIQVGLQSMADRYTYLPSIGLLLAVAWAVGGWLREWPRLQPVGALACAFTVATLASLALRQQRHWSNTLTLFEHALAVDPDNWLGHNMVGLVYASNGERAIEQGNLPLGLRHHATAAEHLRRSVELNSGHYLSFHNYAWSLYRLGRLDESVGQFRRANACYDGFGWSHLYLAVALSDVGRPDEAESEFAAAARLLPNNAAVPFERGEALSRRGRREEARAWYAAALQLNPRHAGARRALEREAPVASLPGQEELTPPAK
jgi:tetratricopeptide (TPR) repeat protein